MLTGGTNDSFEACLPHEGHRLLRCSIVVRGTVQGVGFRPFVHRLAASCGVSGFVRNQVDGVRIAAEGPLSALNRFLELLEATAPPSARIESRACTWEAPAGETGFRILASDAPTDVGTVLLCPDLSTCDECREELFSPANRRYRYPFISCASCGPRLTIIERAPYDRERTTMREFALCAPCRSEYRDSHDRRFHAQTNGCADCGPRLALCDRDGRAVAGDPLALAVEGLRAGRILALKGLGGFHLACDATQQCAVEALRQRKHRDEKPFALMVSDLSAVDALVALQPEEQAWLQSSERPIVLAPRREGARVAAAVAPGQRLLGIMLPYTPLHHLLLRAMADVPLVMTSGNRCDEPIVFDECEAIERLRGIADLFLVHDRPIEVSCDDSVGRVIAGRRLLLRRSRGYAPSPQPLPLPCARRMLALGGHLKATFALGRESNAVLSHHLGDLGDHRSYSAYAAAIAHYERVFRFAPDLLVHDLHPEYASTYYARERAATEGLPLLAVQHHHAHVASCMAEHGLACPVIGVAFDGTGYGVDGALWGGEFLIGNCHSFQRGAHLRYVALPGGDRAAREPWRMAFSHLVDADASDFASRLLGARIPDAARQVVSRMIERRLHSPPCSSAGRLFDAVAALTGLRDRTSFEGQAAMDLEHAASELPGGRPYPFSLELDRDPIVIDTRPLVRAVAIDCIDRIAPQVVAQRFHETVAVLVETTCCRLRDRSGLETVMLSGGVFQNALLAKRVQERLSGAGFRVYQHSRVPANDGGLAVGQLAVAAAATSGSLERGI